MDKQIQHTIEQVLTFSQMLKSGCIPEHRTRDGVVAQLGFNLGRFVELTSAGPEGKLIWNQLETYLIQRDYDGLVDFGKSLISRV